MSSLKPGSCFMMEIICSTPPPPSYWVMDGSFPWQCLTSPEVPERMWEVEVWILEWLFPEVITPHGDHNVSTRYGDQSAKCRWKFLQKSKLYFPIDRVEQLREGETISLEFSISGWDRAVSIHSDVGINGKYCPSLSNWQSIEDFQVLIQTRYTLVPDKIL